jgi:hypothetical protein
MQAQRFGAGGRDWDDSDIITITGIKLNGSRSCFVVIRVRPSTFRLFIRGH